jgi:hypothetical protein
VFPSFFLFFSPVSGKGVEKMGKEAFSFPPSFLLSFLLERKGRGK